jgi:hypothetical protein
VPERLTVCGLPLALSVMLSEAASAPAREGVKVTAIVQLALAATELPQVSPVSAKSLALVPVTARLVMLKVALPVLLRVKVCAELVTSMAWLLKAKLVGERLTMGLPVAGLLMAKFSGLEAPPPGAGFVTITA